MHMPIVIRIAVGLCVIALIGYLFGGVKESASRRGHAMIRSGKYIYICEGLVAIAYILVVIVSPSPN